MSNPKYTMMTVAACEPAYVQEALKHVSGFVADLISKAGAVSARYGILATGEQVGSIVLFQSYQELGDIDKAYQVYAESGDYQAVINSGKISVTLRNIIKLEDVGLSNPSSEMPKYGVVTRFAGPLLLERMPEMVPLWEDNGAMILRYGTLMTGSNAGKRILIAGYPSMDAIEKTYDALRDSATYQSIMAEIQVDMRNIIRTVG